MDTDEIKTNDDGEAPKTGRDPEAFEKFQKCAAEVLSVPLDKVVPEATFEELDADSLDIVELVMALEEAFEIEIEEDELDGVETVEQAFTLVSSKI